MKWLDRLLKIIKWHDKPIALRFTVIHGHVTWKIKYRLNSNDLDKLGRLLASFIYWHGRNNPTAYHGLEACYDDCQSDIDAIMSYCELYLARYELGTDTPMFISNMMNWN